VGGVPLVGGRGGTLDEAGARSGTPPLPVGPAGKPTSACVCVRVFVPCLCVCVCVCVCMRASVCVRRLTSVGVEPNTAARR